MAETAKTGDPYVLNVQEWLNNTYRGKTGYTEIIENGKTGWTTIYALLHALQIELGITSTANNFGNGTINVFNSKYPNGVKQQEDGETTKRNIYGIIQGALLCKGYSIGTNTPTCNFYAGTGSAIKKLRADAGIDSSSSTVTLNIMKSLMSMDYFYSYDTSAKTKNIQKIQRYLNANYEKYIGLTPCDGVYGRGTNKALIYAIQAEEGMSTSVANGNFGPSTKRCCPTIPYSNSETNYAGAKYTSSQIGKFTKLVNMGLYVNGVGDGNFGTTLDVGAVKQFQSKYALSTTGIVNLTTWLSIFISSGDTTRSAKACDCATILTAEKAKTLFDNGYRYVGRYLSGYIASGASKALSREELQIAFNAGLRVFPIQQASANKVSYFTEAQAVTDCDSAYEHATNLGIPRDTVIYFAVDCDPQDTDITSNIIPYFKKVFETMKNTKNGKYKVGIYGTRNVCSRVSDKGYAVRSFVSDMSTGFSGNLGFTIPNNWAFDQFATVTIGSGNGQIEIDKDGYSGLDSGISYITSTTEEPTITPDPDYTKGIGYDTNSPQPAVMLNMSNKPYNVYSSKKKGVANTNPANKELEDACDDLGFLLANPAETNLWGVDGVKVGEIKPGDFFIRFECRNHEYDSVPEFAGRVVNEGDSVHKVLFRDSDGNIRYGYIQEVITADEYQKLDSRRYGKENFFYYNFDATSNKLVKSGSSPSETVYTVKRELKCIKKNGTSLTTLEVGTQLKGAGSAGSGKHEYMYFAKKRVSSNDNWEDLDIEDKTGAFVCLDMKNGVNGYDRPLW